MKKPKSKARLATERKKALKRNLRFKASRKKIARKREVEMERKRAEKKKYEEFMAKMLEARLKGEF